MLGWLSTDSIDNVFIFALAFWSRQWVVLEVTTVPKEDAFNSGLPAVNDAAVHGDAEVDTFWRTNLNSYPCKRMTKTQEKKIYASWGTTLTSYPGYEMMKEQGPSSATSLWFVLKKMVSVPLLSYCSSCVVLNQKKASLTPLPCDEILDSSIAVNDDGIPSTSFVS